jgi:chorismate dehydratase
MVPSQLLTALIAGELDSALVSAAGVLPDERLKILPVGCVAARGAVRSIRIYSRFPLETVRSLALDASSRSGVSLARLILRCRYGRDPEYVTLPPDLDAMLARADAALLIGDPALKANERLENGRWAGPPLLLTDLGSEWFEITGLPFVYAVWASPTTADSATLTQALRRALAIGLQRREALALSGARALGIAAATARAYLVDTIRYRLEAEERAGLARFCELAREFGVLPADSAVRFAPEPA